MTTIKKQEEGKIDYRKKFKQPSLGPALYIDGIQKAAEVLFYLEICVDKQ
jgi:hypothetical protein